MNSFYVTAGISLAVVLTIAVVVIVCEMSMRAAERRAQKEISRREDLEAKMQAGALTDAELDALLSKRLDSRG